MTRTAGGADRGVSSVVGYGLLALITVVGVTTVVLVGGTAVSDVQQSAQASHAEEAMSQFDSRAAAVALGGTPSSTITLGNAQTGQVAVDDDAGRITLVAVENGTSRTLLDAQFGAVVYEIGGTEIAYQGGGVWRSEDSGTVVVSPPAYYYRDQTLTFPVIRVTGGAYEGSPGVPLTIRENGSEPRYPTDSERNPLSRGYVEVHITSEYHRGWATYLRSRMEGNVRDYPSNQTVIANLSVPMTETFDYGVAATANGPNAIDNKHDTFDGPQLIGARRPSPDEKIEDRISGCASGGCTDLSSALGDDTLTNGTYYSSGDASLDGVTYDTGGGDIDVVVDGDLTFSSDHDLTGNGSVTFYVRGDVSEGAGARVNTGGDSSDLTLLVHSDGTSATIDGQAQFTGFIYAPNASFTINGGGSPGMDNLVGAIVVRTATANGNHANLDYSPPVTPVVTFSTGTDVTYLHVTERRIVVNSR